MRSAALTSTLLVLAVTASHACGSKTEDKGCAGEACGGMANDASVEGSSGGAPGTGGASSGGNGSGGAPTVVCEPRAAWPAPPAEGGTPGGGVEIVAVEYTATLGDDPPAPVQPTRYLSLGFDLDAVCTAEAGGGACTLPSYATGVVDGPGGRDNSFGAVFQRIRSLTSSSFSSENYSQELQRGSANLILRVTEYNGEAADDQLRLEVFRAAPFGGTSDAGALPLWDGTDVWPVDSASVTDADRSRPTISDPNAYAAGQKLVASFDRFELPLDIGLSQLGRVRLTLELTAALVVCDIRRTATGRWGSTLEGCVIGGRVVADGIVKQLGAFPDPVAANSSLCRDSQAYSGFRDDICEAVDVHSDPAAANGRCDSLSFAMGFDTRPANLGDVIVGDAPVSGCGPSVDPRNDSCANHGRPFSGGTGDGGPGDGG